MASKLGNVSGAVYLGAVLALVGVAAVVFFILRSRGAGKKKMSASTATWRDFIEDQGKMLVACLLAGAALSSVASYLQQTQSTILKGGRLVSNVVNPSEHVVFEEEDVSNYHEVTVMARTTAPTDGSADVTVYGDSGGSSSAQEIGQMEAIPDSWSEWRHSGSLKHVTIKVTNGGKGRGATAVQVLLFLAPK